MPEDKTIEHIDKLNKLEDLSRTFKEFDPLSPESDFDYWHVLLSCERICQFFRGDNICELGCSTGTETIRLLEFAQKLTIVDGSATNLNIAKNNIIKNYDKNILNKVSLVNELWEDFTPEFCFTDVVFSRGLEHVEDPIKLLTSINKWMPSDARIHIIIANAHSLHRRIGVAMGLLKDTFTLNERDIKLGHKRVYDKQTLFDHLKSSGFKMIHQEGIYLKPLSNNQMKHWDEKLIRAFLEIGKELPDYCSEIYVCGEKT